MTAPVPVPDTAQQFCMERIAHFQAKADHNKREALASFVILLSCTLASPLFIALGPGYVIGKVIPSILSTLATACAVWLQQRKPQQLWILYRTTQRRLEAEQISFRFQVNEYADAADPSKLLAQRAVLVCSTTHDQWVPLVPKADNITEALQTGKTKAR